MKQITRFYLNLIIFAVILSALLVFLNHLSSCDDWGFIIARYTGSIDYLFGDVGTKDIIPYIEDVREKDGTSKLIIGDSICRQIFDDLSYNNNDYTIAGTNQAVTMAGQYILAREYLDNHPQATDIYLIVHPESLEKTFDTRVGYQYVVMPFVLTGTIKDLDTDTIKIMESVYGSIFMRPDIVNLIDRSGVNRKLYLNMLKTYSKDYVMKERFELADKYLCKINDMCTGRGAAFHLLPAPVSEHFRPYVEEMREDFGASQISRLNPAYLDEIYYYPDDRSEDGRHFSGDYANRECYNQIIMDMYGDTGLTDTLSLEH